MFEQRYVRHSRGQPNAHATEHVDWVIRAITVVVRVAWQEPNEFDV